MRSIPIGLAAHFAGRITSVCKLVKMRLKDGSILSFTTADHDITYTDGPDGAIVYPYVNGISPSAFDQSASTSVDNAVLTGIISANGVTEQQIRVGIFNHARFWIYEVNYLDLSQGHYIWASGFTGQTKFSENGFAVEMRSKMQSLRQPISEAFTLTCPVRYGSPACGKEFEWFSAIVDAVDTEEPDRVFTVMADSLWPGGQKFKVGVIRVLTGDNAGAEIEVELHDGYDFSMLLAFPYPMAVDDEIEVRIDCNKVARDIVYGCKSPDRWDVEWIYHHRGFPDTPIADAASLRFPGAQAPSHPGGGTVPMEAP